MTLKTLAPLAGVALATTAAAIAREPDFATVERQFRELPMAARRLTGPLFWLHGDEPKERLELYVGKVAEGGNGRFTAESRPHPDWLGPEWYRDLDLCLAAAKRHNLQMCILDERWWPSQSIGGQAPPRYAAKKLAATATDVAGPAEFTAGSYSGSHYIAAVAGRVTVNGQDAGGFIGRPLRLEVTKFLKAGVNQITIAPFAPKSAWLSVR